MSKRVLTIEFELEDACDVADWDQEFAILANDEDSEVWEFVRGHSDEIVEVVAR